jgi:hypothetical protein
MNRFSRGIFVKVKILVTDSKAQSGVGGQHHAPAALLPGKTRYLLKRRLDGPQDRSGRVKKISPIPGFDHRRGIFAPRRNNEVGKFGKLFVEKILSSAAQKILHQSNME